MCHLKRYVPSAKRILDGLYSINNEENCLVSKGSEEKYLCRWVLFYSFCTKVLI